MRIHRFSLRDPDSRRFFATLYSKERSLFGVSLETNANRKHRFCHAYVQLGGEKRQVMFALAVPWLFAVWLGFEMGPLWKPVARLWNTYDHKRKAHRKGPLGYDARTTGINLDGARLSFSLMAADHGYTKRSRIGDRRLRRMRPLPLDESTRAQRLLGGWKFSIQLEPRDLLLGKREHSKTESEPHEVLVPMPEGGYPATATRVRHTWQRKRRRRPSQVRIDWDIDMSVPIPVPGKGENSWDIDDDAIFATASEAEMLRDALAEVAQRVMRTRERYAGPGWTPVRGWPEGVALDRTTE